MEADISGHNLNNKKVINGWAFFDWANSAYALVITTAIFPYYFSSVTDDFVNILGYQIANYSLYSYAVGIAYIILVIFSPLLSGIADYGGRRKYFLKFFTVMGSVACISLFFFKSSADVWLGTSAFILATIGFAGGLVFYNAYLPEIATKDKFDMVSAKGFAYGYVGSLILLGLNLVIILNPEWFGITDSGVPARIAFVMVGVWWLGFAQITFNRLPKDKPQIRSGNMVRKGIEELLGVWNIIKKRKNILGFLLAYFFFTAGVQTVLYLAATFAEDILNFEFAELIFIIIVLQFVAIFGAYLFAKVSDLAGNKFSLMTMLVIWIVVCYLAYTVGSKSMFYWIAGLVGLVMGGIQAISRSTYSKLLDESIEDHTSFFSFYDVLQKLAIVMGTFSFGFIAQVTGGMRNSILALTVFFIIGILILSRVSLQPDFKRKI